MKKKRTKEKNHYYVQWGIATIILMIYIVGTLFSYNSTMTEISRNRAVDKVSKQAMEIKGFYEGRISTAQDLAKSIADFCSKQDDICDARALECISSINGSLSYKNIYLVKPNGNAIDKDGNSYRQLDTSDQYNALLSGEESICMQKDENGRVIMMIAAPIVSDEALKGNVIIEYCPNQMKDLIETPIYSYTLVYKNGLVAEQLGEYQICDVGDNILDILKGISFKEGSYSSFSNGLNSERSTVNYVVIKKGGYYLLSQPIHNGRASIIITVKDKQIARSTSEENQNTHNLIVKLIVSLCVFIVLLAIIYIINRLAFSKTSKELQNKAETDLLTDLLNKISTETKIKEYISGEGKNKTCMMCVLDIDNFKKINDTMGHAFGDEVLASLGKQIRAEFRVSDIIGRTGGDEFVIFLKDLKDEDVIKKEADRVATFFKNFTVGEYTKYAATASIGAAMYPRDASDFESLYKAADTALYKAKNRGKNQMAFYNESDNQ